MQQRILLVQIVEDMHDIHSKILSLMDDKRLSTPSLAEMIGIKYTTLHSALNNRRKINFDIVEAICHATGTPLSYFSRDTATMGLTTDPTANGVAKAAAKLMDTAMNAANMAALRRQSQISVMDVLNWLRRTNARLEDFDAIKESIDLFHVMGADDVVPKPYRIGRKSLSTVNFEIDDEHHYEKKVAQFHPDVLANIKKGRIEASFKPYMMADVEIRANVGGKWIAETYFRLTAKVFLPGGQELTLVHAEMVPKNQALNRGSTDLDLIQPPTNPVDAPPVSDHAK